VCKHATSRVKLAYYIHFLYMLEVCMTTRYIAGSSYDIHHHVRLIVNVDVRLQNITFVAKYCMPIQCMPFLPFWQKGQIVSRFHSSFI
jgi:hypothetical protein